MGKDVSMANGIRETRLFFGQLDLRNITSVRTTRFFDVGIGNEISHAVYKDNYKCTD